MTIDRVSTSSAEGLDAQAIARGMKLLRVVMAVLLLVSIAASAAFATGRFDAYPYAWF